MHFYMYEIAFYGQWFETKYCLHLTLFLFGLIRDNLFCRLRGMNSEMSIFVNISFHELNVSPVKPIPECQPPIACVESEKRMTQCLQVFFAWSCILLLLQMVVVVKLRWKDQREVISRMVIHNLDQEPCVPGPQNRQRSSHKQRSHWRGDNTSQEMFYGVSVQSCDCHWGLPLMVNLVNMLV